MPENARNALGSAVALVVGAVLAVVTILGLVASQVDSSSGQPSQTIPYGSTG
ncbi:MAG TPA: hypothetical protein VFM09_05025 [Marmoricola sp.]|nr:hypothetical protein [Marmoricola sp.]